MSETLTLKNNKEKDSKINEVKINEVGELNKKKTIKKRSIKNNKEKEEDLTKENEKFKKAKEENNKLKEENKSKNSKEEQENKDDEKEQKANTQLKEESQSNSLSKKEKEQEARREKDQEQEARREKDQEVGDDIREQKNNKKNNKKKSTRREKDQEAMRKKEQEARRKKEQEARREKEQEVEDDIRERKFYLFTSSGLHKRKSYRRRRSFLLPNDSFDLYDSVEEKNEDILGLSADYDDDFYYQYGTSVVYDKKTHLNKLNGNFYHYKYVGYIDYTKTYTTNDFQELTYNRNGYRNGYIKQYFTVIDDKDNHIEVNPDFSNHIILYGSENHMGGIKDLVQGLFTLDDIKEFLDNIVDKHPEVLFYPRYFLSEEEADRIRKYKQNIDNLYNKLSNVTDLGDRKNKLKQFCDDAINGRDVKYRLRNFLDIYGVNEVIDILKDLKQFLDCIIDLEKTIHESDRNRREERGLLDVNRGAMRNLLDVTLRLYEINNDYKKSKEMLDGKLSELSDRDNRKNNLEQFCDDAINGRDVGDDLVDILPFIGEERVKNVLECLQKCLECIRKEKETCAFYREEIEQLQGQIELFRDKKITSCLNDNKMEMKQLLDKIELLENIKAYNEKKIDINNALQNKRRELQSCWSLIRKYRINRKIDRLNLMLSVPQYYNKEHIDFINKHTPNGLEKCACQYMQPWEFVD